MVLGVAAGSGAPVAWYLGSPLLIGRTVNEPFRGGVAPQALTTREPGMPTRCRRTRRLAPWSRGAFARADVVTGYVELGRFKGTMGGQKHTPPRGIALADHRAVVIYCKPFHVVFALEPLEPAN